MHASSESTDAALTRHRLGISVTPARNGQNVPMATASRSSRPNTALYNLRDARGESQEDVAAALNQLSGERGRATAVTGNHVSRWERGANYPSPLYRQLLAEHFGVTVADLGLVRQRSVPTGHSAPMVGPAGDVLIFSDGEPDEDPDVVASKEEWLLVRKQINAFHTPLMHAAAELYPEAARVGTTGLLADPSWIVDGPLIDLAEVKIEIDETAGPAPIDGTGPETELVRPLRSPNARYERYSHAVRDVARPRLFENRPSWRLTSATFDGGSARLSFGDMTYFDAMDVSEAIAHETAAGLVVNGTSVAPPTWRGLKLRKAVGDPFDLQRRAQILSINTLTIRLDKSGSGTVILHNRSAANVATSGGIIGVMPAGVFQPSTIRAGQRGDDFDLWRNIMREYSEEYLGNAEHAGDGYGADYSTEPFASLKQARSDGRFRVYCAGLALGALDLWAGLETIAVIEAEVFDDIFAGLVDANEEGTVLRIGAAVPTVHVPFTEQVIDELHGTGRLAPETTFSLRAAWQHRAQLLAR
ncbi:hypothetical protein Kfla_2178 [Kribbella flavida DSM 17836]|uniref:HTH cro/C1-type domain-containing protein n=2 Tax=Kribbella flavida TaxID=182640 RepID=D2PSD3_KRIFD|nr:hypothetical protein Kfla_2178 [Kribbella flavida DSM 17836]